MTYAERIRVGFDAFNRRDFDVLVEICHPEVEWTPPQELPGSRTYHGPEGVRAAIGDMVDVFPDLHAEAVEFREDGERVIALYRWRGTALGSGASIDPFEVKAGAIGDFDEGLLRVARFWTTWEATLGTAEAEKQRARQEAGP